MTDNKRAADDSERDEALKKWMQEVEGTSIEVTPLMRSAYRDGWADRAALSSRADGGKGEAVRAYAIYRTRLEENEGEEFFFAANWHNDYIAQDGERIVSGLFVPDTAPQAECAPREAQPDVWARADWPTPWTRHGSGESEWWSHDGFEARKSSGGHWVLLRDGKTLFMHEYLHEVMTFAAPTPERADADTAGAAEYIGPHGRALLDAMASQERADAEEDDDYMLTRAVRNAETKFDLWEYAHRADTGKDAARWKWLKMQSTVGEQWGIMKTPRGQWDAYADAAILAANKEPT
jgi:hypothetical protein